MKLFVKKDKRSAVDLEIEHVLEYMKDLPPSIAEYKTAAENLERLLKVKGAIPQKAKFSPDTLLVVAGNLLGIVVILTYEKANVITSKAVSFILKGRV